MIAYDFLKNGQNVKLVVLNVNYAISLVLSSNIVDIISIVAIISTKISVVLPNIGRTIITAIFKMIIRSEYFKLVD